MNMMKYSNSNMNLINDITYDTQTLSNPLSYEEDVNLHPTDTI